MKSVSGSRRGIEALPDEVATRAPGAEDGEDQPRGEKREPAAIGDLEEGGAEEREVDHQEETGEREDAPRGHLEALSQHHQREENRGDDHPSP